MDERTWTIDELHAALREGNATDAIGDPEEVHGFLVWLDQWDGEPRMCKCGQPVADGCAWDGCDPSGM